MNRYAILPKTRNLIVRYAVALFLVSALVGCRTRTVYVPSGDPVRLAEPVSGATVWVKDSNGDWIKGKMDLPEGWYALPDPGPEVEK